MTTARCDVEIALTASERATVEAIDACEFTAYPRMFCNLHKEPAHDIHAASILPQPGAGPDDEDSPEFWIFWGDDGTRELRWTEMCMLPMSGGDLCLLPVGHLGVCVS